MEEIIFNGYCIQLDQNRIVFCDVEDGKLTPDCNYYNCSHKGICSISKSIENIIDKEEAK